MQVIRILGENMADAVAAAAGTIRKGGIVGFPTETYYGLGAAYLNTDALKRLYALKHRSGEKPIPLIAGSREALARVARDLSVQAVSIIEKFWPGPLTLLLPAQPGLSQFLTADTGNVAVRIPGASFALELARVLEFPITATSANLSGSPPAGDAAAVAGYFDEELDLLVDAGRTPGGAPSTIVRLSGKTISLVREGQIPFDAILASTKKIPDRKGR